MLAETAIPGAHGRDPWTLLANAGQSIALVLVMLPLTGWFVRLVAFSTDGGTGPTSRLAMALPLPELAWAGAIGPLAVGPGLTFGFYRAARMAPALRLVAAAREHRDELRELVRVRELGLVADRALLARLEHVDRADTHRVSEVELDALRHRIAEGERLLEAEQDQFQTAQGALDEARKPFHEGRAHRFAFHEHGLITTLALILVTAIMVLISPGFPLTIILGIGGGLTTVWMQRVGGRTGKLTLAMTWPGIFGVIFLSALAVGLTFTSEAAQQYQFAPNAGLADGFYVRMGASDGQLFLRKCPGGPITEIPESEVQSVSITDRSVSRSWREPATILDALVAGRSLEFGISYSCPP